MPRATSTSRASRARRTSPRTARPAATSISFLTKLDPTGTVLLSSSFIGGNGADEARGLAIDASGNAYITGVTRSTNFPTVNAIQGTLNGESRRVRAEDLRPTAAVLLFSTYLGGSGLDEGAGVAIDAARNVYVTGTTRSADFPTASPRQAAHAGHIDAFVSKLNPAGSSLLYSSYLGGTASDSAFGIAADPAGNVTVVGTTNSVELPRRRTPRRASTAASSTPSSRGIESERRADLLHLLRRQPTSTPRRR